MAQVLKEEIRNVSCRIKCEKENKKLLFRIYFLCERLKINKIKIGKKCKVSTKKEFANQNGYDYQLEKKNKCKCT